MKICGISDMHGKLNFDIDKCDILCICGDIMPLSIQTYHEAGIKWLKKTFIPWCEKKINQNKLQYRNCNLPSALLP